MDSFSAAEMAGMQATQGESLQDTCILFAWSEQTQDAFGQKRETWTAGSPIACGYNPRGGKEVAGEGTLPIVTDATVRLPITATVDRRDRVQITHRFGAALLVARTFEVVGEPRRGPSGLQVDLKQVDL